MSTYRGVQTHKGDAVALDFDLLATFDQWWVEWRSDYVRSERCTSERVRMKEPAEVSKSPRHGRHPTQKMYEL
jgi:hypothetical protein